MLNRTHRFCLLSTCLVGAALMACSGSRQSGFDDGNAGGAAATDEDGTFGGPGDKDGTSSSSKGCNPSPDNYDVPGNKCDDDGDGKVDNPPSCDDSLPVSGDAEAFAKAIGICTKATGKNGYGLVKATFTRGYQQTDEPANEQHGILPKFGNIIKPREGDSLGVLSTGWGREYNGQGKEPFGGVSIVNLLGQKLPMPAGEAWNNAAGKAPPGFPKAAAGCKQADVVANVIDLKLELKAPANAKGVQFDFNFYSGEWPAYVCSPFNDGFIAYLTAKGFNDGKPDNMSFDKDNNPVSVNNGFFDRCTPNVEIGCSEGGTDKSSCPGGDDELAGTGFGQQGSWCSAFTGGATDKSTNGGATGWLTSTAPVEPGETFTLEFMIWDTGDAMLDSSVLLDHFTWVEGETKTGTARPVK